MVEQRVVQVKRFFVALGYIILMEFGIVALAMASPVSAIAVSALIGLAGLFAVVKPMPQIGLGHRGYAVAVIVFVSFYGLVGGAGFLVHQRSTMQELETLKTSGSPAEVAAFLESKKSEGEMQYLDALKFLRPDEYESEVARLKAEEIKRENERQAEREREKQAERERERLAAQAKAESERQAKAEERRKGFHCLHAWDGAHPEFKEYITKRLRNPGSFEHVETRITPVNVNGTHSVIMTYRAENGFGGMNVEKAVAIIDNRNCNIISVQTQ